MSEITKDMTLDEILRQKPEAMNIFINYGMYCIGCPAAQMETLDQVSDLYGFETDEVLERLNSEV